MRQQPRKGVELLSVIWTETVLSFATIGLRWYTRRYIRGRISPDDWILLVTWLLMFTWAALASVSVTYGLGTHVDELTVEEIVGAVKFLVFGQFTISLAMGTSKAAVAVFLLRIVQETWQKIVLWYWILSIMTLSIFQAVAVFTQCTPFKSIWDSRVPREHCVFKLATVAKIFCAYSASMDFFLAIFPWIVLWNFNMKRKEKVTICLALSLGIFAGACGTIRTVGLDVLNNTTDFLYMVSNSAMWTNSEVTLTIICICIPTLRPLVKCLIGEPLTEEQSRISRDYEKSTREDISRRQSRAADYLSPEECDTPVEANTPERCTMVELDSGSSGAHRSKETAVSFEDARQGDEEHGRQL